MSIDQMRDKLLEWNPRWNVNRLTDEQVMAIYSKERKEIVNELLEKYTK